MNYQISLHKYWMNIKQVRLLKIEIENVPKDFVIVLFATPQDNGLGNLT
jgi:hypothetical protein